MLHWRMLGGRRQSRVFRVDQRIDNHLAFHPCCEGFVRKNTTNQGILVA